LCMALWIGGGKTLAAGDNNRRSVDVRKNLEKISGSPCAARSGSSRNSLTTSQRRTFRGNSEERGEPGEPGSWQDPPTWWCGQAARGRPRNRLVSELLARLRAPASHTCRGPECIAAGTGGARYAVSNLHPSRQWERARMKLSITDLQPGRRGRRIASERILEFFAESPCAVHPEGC
jgi:hypothetical protein